MIKIKIELIPFGFLKPKTLGTCTIINDGTGTLVRGNYEVSFTGAANQAWKKCKVEDFPRTKLLVWDILYRALKQVIGERNKGGCNVL